MFSDPISDLIKAISSLCENEPLCELLLYDEPSGHKVAFARIEERHDLYQVCVDELQSGYGETVRVGTRLVDCTAKRDLLIVQILYELLKARTLLGFKWYKEGRRGEFDETAFRAMTKKLPNKSMQQMAGRQC